MASPTPARAASVHGGVHFAPKTLEKANFALLQHELEYQSKSVRGFCGVCPFTEQHEDHKGTKSTQLMCVSCRVWVCNSSPCLMAHLKFGRGTAVTDKCWSKCETNANQGQYVAAAEHSKKRKENREE